MPFGFHIHVMMLNTNNLLEKLVPRKYFPIIGAKCEIVQYEMGENGISSHFEI